MAHFLSAEKLTSLFDSLPFGIVVHALDGRIISANESALDILGLSLSEITGKTSMDPDWQAVREDGSPYPGEEHPAMTCLATGAPVRDVVIGVKSHAKREQRWLLVYANPLQTNGRLVGAYACFEDITESKRVGMQLANTRGKLELAVSGANLGTYDAHIKLGTTKVNDRYLALLGYAPGELEMSVAEWMRRIHPEDLPRIKAHYDEVLALRSGYVNNEYRLRRKDESWVWVLDSGQVISVDEHGEPLWVAGILMDISSRKEMELALRESEARYRIVVEASPVAILVFVDQRVAMANPACTKLFRASSEQELLGRDVWSLSSPDYHPLLRQRIERAMLYGVENPVAEVEILRIDGTSLLVDGVSVAIDYRGQRAIHVMMYDATHRKQAEILLRKHREEMERTLSLEVAYQTVAGIAHELNQPLNVITTLGVAAERQAAGCPDLPPRLQETVAAMTAAARRAGNVLGELIDVLRQPALPVGAVRVDNLVDEVVAQAKAVLSFQGTLNVLLPPYQVWIAGNALQIEKIMLNLLRNAIEACQSCSSRNKEPRISIEVKVEERDVRICISDNGPGINPSSMSALFKPFASSKSGGLGMGLAICHALAQSLGGHLWQEPVADGGRGSASSYLACSH